MTKNELKSKVVVDNVTKCWLWQGSVAKNGYAICSRTGNPSRYASRTVYMLYKGVIPKGFVVMHSCDNPACVNPKHLSVGTQQDNIDDMMAKGRHNPENQRAYMKRLWQDPTYAVRRTKQSLEAGPAGTAEARKALVQKYKDVKWALEQNAKAIEALRKKWADPVWADRQLLKNKLGKLTKKAENGN